MARELILNFQMPLRDTLTYNMQVGFLLIEVLPFSIMMLLFYSNIADSSAKTELIPIFAHHYITIGIPYLYIFARYMNNLAKINKTFDTLESKLILI